MQRILIFTISFFITGTALLGQWREVPLAVDSSFLNDGSNNAIVDIEFNTDSTAVAIAEWHLILGTSDYGETWYERQDLSDTTTGTFTGLYYIDSSQFVLTGLQYIYRSFDEFHSYQAINYVSPYLGYLGGLSVRIPNEFHFLSINRNTYVKSENFTVDTLMDIIGLDTSDPAFILSAMEVFFVNDSVGYILSSKNWNHLGSSVIHRTMDGGKTWKKVLDGFAIMDIHFFSESYGIGFDGGQLFTTSDYGDSWQWQDLHIWGWPPNSNVPHPLEIVNDSVWYVYTKEEIIRTTDGGVSWQHITPPPCGICQITELECPNDTTCFVGTTLSLKIFKTDNVEHLITGTDASQSELLDKASLIIYPNPTHSHITVKGLSRYHNPTITVSNALGQVIHYAEVMKMPVQLSVADLSSGVYLVTVTEDGQPVATGKFVVE